GALLCLAYALNGRDFHFENLLAAGEHPVLLDLEMVLGHRFELVEDIPDATLAATIARRAWTESVMNVGMLPSLKPERNGYMFEVGALGNAVTTEAVVVRCWHDVNTDAMRRGTRTVAAQAGANNLPRIAGEVAGPGPYVDRIVAGFEAMYRTLLVRREELLAPGSVLDRMRPHVVRFILRNTSLYNALLDRCLHPQFLRSGIERSLQLDVLAKTFLALDERPTIWPAVAHERDALERLDIPLFAAPATSTDLPLDDGGVIENCFQSSAHAEMLRRIRSLAPNDCRRQTELIHGAFLAGGARDVPAPLAMSAPGSTQPSSDADDLSPAVAIEEARRIAAQLRLATLDPSMRAPSWIGMNYVAAARRYVLAPMSYGVCDGYTGVALFFAAMHRADGDGGYDALARSTISPLLSRLTEIERVVRLRRATEVGVGSGLSGAVYGLLCIARLLDDDEVHAAARRIATLIDPYGDPRALRTDLHDVLGGSAGAVLALLALDGYAAEGMWRDRAAAFGERLLRARVEHRESGRHVWAGHGGVIETGFAHGQAGIAYALERLAAATRRADFEEAAREAIAHERTLLAARLGAVGDVERRGGWARGATGIAMARLGSPGVAHDDDTRAEMETAIDASRAALNDGVDSLCCGTAGRIDLLLDAAVVLSRPTLRAAATRAAATMVARSRRGGTYDTGWPQPSAWQSGLFHGPAGIGYILLRATMPEILPSPLLWR
ncbi:MAG: type 2 lanthipeptide synthetase LanM, partial [Gemmatimonadaceae bacterium]